MIFKNKQNIYLSPYTPMTKGLESYLNNILNIKVKGYIDSSKTGENIYSPLDIKKLKIDDIYILSPNWGKDIYNNLNKYIDRKKITILNKDNSSYKKSILNSKLIYYIDNILIRILNKSFDYFNLKVVKLWTNRIGEFCLESEAFLDNIKSNEFYKNKKIICLSYKDDSEIANKTLYDLYRVVFKRNKNLILLENNFLNRYLQYCINNKFIDNKYQLNIEQKSNAYELFTNKTPIINFTKQDIEKGEFLLQKMNFKKPFVCVFARDSHYLEQNFKYYDWSYHNYRDADINSYELAIKYLIDKNYNVIRIGSVSNQELNFKHPRCIDYPFSDFRSEFMDIFLISQCSFAIGGHSGILDICNAFSKTRLGVNNMPIDCPSYATKDDLYIPKKIKKDSKYISLEKYFEIIESSGLSHFKSETYKQLNFEIQNNSPKEILMLVKEYLGDFTYNEIDVVNLEKYYKAHSKSKQFSNVKTKIGTQFLRDNPWFIKG